MIVVDTVEQGTEEWRAIKCGLPSASKFDKILTATREKSEQRTAYMNKLIAERLMGRPLDGYQNDSMLRGTDMEPEARAFYEFNRDAEIKQVAFVYGDDSMRYGASPDGLVLPTGGLEMKNPEAHTHIEYMRAGKCPTKYWVQVQGNIWICEADWWDFLSYYPGLDPLIVRVPRDDDFIAALRDEVLRFCDDLDETTNKLRKAA